MARLNCPHCEKPLIKVVTEILSAFQTWSVGEKDLFYTGTEVTESMEPRCWECDGNVGAFLKAHGITCDWTAREASSEPKFAVGDEIILSLDGWYCDGYQGTVMGTLGTYFKVLLPDRTLGLFKSGEMKHREEGTP